MDGERSRGNATQDHEVREVPVQDARDLEPSQILELEPHGAARETEPGREVAKCGERCAVQRHREAAAQCGHVDAVTVIARDHRDAS
jgi:hypothetical protein